jgi:uncharacterized SAM-binding protein YcdF (DUF218 family)
MTRAPGRYQAKIRRGFGSIIRGIFIAGCIAAVLVGIGFLWWVNNLPEVEVPMRSKADGIVVLTGSRFRINDALELLAAGHGKRLLISGVYPATKLSEIAHMMPEFERWFVCCVDLDHMALNTIGNAVETKRWAREQRSQSLIVVTSNFHMPRALTEISHQLPDVRLVAYPVVSDRVRIDSWWSSPATARLLFMEYLKYMVASVRVRIDGIA